MSECDFVGSAEQRELRKAQEAVFDLSQWLRSHGYGGYEFGLAFKSREYLTKIENQIRFKFKHSEAHLDAETLKSLADAEELRD